MDAWGDTLRSFAVHFRRREGLLRKAVISLVNFGLSVASGFLIDKGCVTLSKVVH